VVNGDTTSDAVALSNVTIWPMFFVVMAVGQRIAINLAFTLTDGFIRPLEFYKTEKHET